MPSRPLPLCRSGPSPDRHPTRKRRGPPNPVIGCQVPHKHRWASAATPTQRNTIHPQEPPRKASDVINGTSMLGKHNPRWPIGNAAETILFPRAGLPAPRGPSLPKAGTWTIAVSAVTAALRSACASVPAGLTSLPRRAGSRLFAVNDAEARWRGWLVTELAGGLARQYRDPRFDTNRVPYPPRYGEG